MNKLGTLRVIKRFRPRKDVTKYTSWEELKRIWNNDGDTAYLYDSSGKLVDIYRY